MCDFSVYIIRGDHQIWGNCCYGLTSRSGSSAVLTLPVYDEPTRLSTPTQRLICDISQTGPRDL